MYAIESAIHDRTDHKPIAARPAGPGRTTRAVLIFACGPGGGVCPPGDSDIIVGDVADSAAVTAIVELVPPPLAPPPKGRGVGARGDSGTAVTGPSRLPHWEQ